MVKLESIHVRNFRLLKDVDISLEAGTTVVVGRNNSGKTSLTELFRRMLIGASPSFYLEDFTLSVHEDFWSAFILRSQGSEDDIVRRALPLIEITLSFSYVKDAVDLGVLADFIIDLDVDSTEARATIRYELQAGKLDDLFDGLLYDSAADEVQQRKNFFKLIKGRIPTLYETSIVAIDPTDELNQKPLEMSKIRTLLHPGFINAQRRLDDSNNKDKDVLGRILEKILSTAKSGTATDEDHTTAQELEGAVKDIQEKMDIDFNGKLDKLLPTLKRFGYPGLNDPQLRTETTLNVERLLENHTKLNYAGANGIGLPEAYNGLGTRNLIYILFQLFEFFKSFQAAPTAPSVHLIFIEEPEAHLHPQMQEVFIRKVTEIVNVFSENLDEGQVWPVQFVVTTHSSHIANEAPFEAVRYFLCVQNGGAHTKVKDLREGLKSSGIEEDKEFLHKYLTLTRCDLFFADKGMLIEGSTERILMPKIIDIVESDPANNTQLSNQYLTVIEVGGAYAHHFINLINFLELRTLIITDIDTTKPFVTPKGRTVYKKCKVTEGTGTSNECLRTWFSSDVTPQALLAKPDAEKLRATIRIAYQVPESCATSCGRSFEDAFMLANPALFKIKGNNDQEKADDAWKKVRRIGKTDFALEYAIEKTNWIVPRYVKEGLLWLAESPLATPIENNDTLVDEHMPVEEARNAPEL